MKYLSYEEFEKTNIFGKGDFNEAFAQYFIGGFLFESPDRPERNSGVSWLM